MLRAGRFSRGIQESYAGASFGRRLPQASPGTGHFALSAMPHHQPLPPPPRFPPIEQRTPPTRRRALLCVMSDECALLATPLFPRARHSRLNYITILRFHTLSCRARCLLPAARAGIPTRFPRRKRETLFDAFDLFHELGAKDDDIARQGRVYQAKRRWPRCQSAKRAARGLRDDIRGKISRR